MKIINGYDYVVLQTENEVEEAALQELRDQYVMAVDRMRGKTQSHTNLNLCKIND